MIGFLPVRMPRKTGVDGRQSGSWRSSEARSPRQMFTDLALSLRHLGSLIDGHLPPFNNHREFRDGVDAIMVRAMAEK